MRKIATALTLAIIGTAPAVADYNPFMGKYENQVAFNVGYGLDSGIIVPVPARFVPFFLFHGQYSQPTTFFGLPARQSLNVAQTVGFGSKYGWQWDRYSIPIGILSADVALLYGKKWYFAVGGGAGLQAQQNERLGAKLLFKFQLTGGFHLTDRVGLEIFMKHFSNANTAANHSYAFYGMGMTYNF